MALVVEEDPRIDLRADLGIDQLMVMVTWSTFMRGDGLDMVGQGKAIGGDA